MYDLCIIGGGASGMTCAITAKMNNPKLNIVILEKNEIIGKKLLATGNGRCNLSNEKCEEFRMALAFFEKIGVLAKMDAEGRFYPYSEEAKEVVAAFLFQLKVLGIETKLGYEVTKVTKEKSFVITDEKGEEIHAQKLVIAVGGKAAPEFGTIGDGYKWARKLGHTVTKTAPALAPIECVEDFSKLKGVRQDVDLTLYKDNEKIAIEQGQLQLTQDGISGICSFNLSRYLTVEKDENVLEALGRYTVSVNFMPEMTRDQVAELLNDRAEIKEAKGRELFRSLVKAPLALDMMKRAGVNPLAYAKDLSKDDINRLVDQIIDWKCHVKNVKGWQHAQVTKGGVTLDEIDLLTMESKVVENLFFTGEVIDYDGPCGGFNLQNAWETGIKAGEYIAGV